MKAYFSSLKFRRNPVLILALLALVQRSGPVLGAGNHRLDPASYQLHPDLEMVVFASEPDVIDPVGITFDEAGRIYVLEMRDYPEGFGPDRKPGGTIRLLEDADGDGLPDTNILFATGLSFPTSMTPWNGGLLVTAPPEIIYLKDTDGDGKADTKEVWFRGFNVGPTDGNLSGLRWGLDGRFHGSNGGNGGNIEGSKSPEPVKLGNLDFSFDPFTRDFTTTYETSGGFGLVFDEWGRRFCTHNSDHIQHQIIAARYLTRFPGLPPIRGTESISDHGAAARIFPIATAETRVNHPEQAGHFSSAGGIGYIGAPHFPGDLAGSVLVCDVVSHIVHRDILVENGPIFTAMRSPQEQKSEFFASRDREFRPVGVELGPDGALYLLDMQRAVIEHPDYIPEKLKRGLDIRAGEDRGRIYRITPKGGLPAFRPRLQDLSSESIVALLAHSNAWMRTTAHRLLVERDGSRFGSSKTSSALREMASNGKEPLGRLHALWTLRALMAPDESFIAKALTDSHPGLRENALLLAEPGLPGSPALQTAVLAMARDSSSRVRFQAALTLGQFDHPGIEAALRTILVQDHMHPWSRKAVLGSLRRGEARLLASMLAEPMPQPDERNSLIDTARELADLSGARVRGPLESDLENVLGELKLKPQAVVVAVLDGLAGGLKRGADQARPGPRTAEHLDHISNDAPRNVLRAAWQVSRALGLPDSELQRAALKNALARAADVAQPLDARLDSIGLLALGRLEDIVEPLFKLLAGVEPSAIQAAAFDVLRPHHDPLVAQKLVDNWRGLSPSLRPSVVGLFIQRRPWRGVLLDALEQEKIQLGEANLDLEQRRDLLRHSSPEIGARAAKLLGDEEYSNRKAVVEQWLEKLPAHGDSKSGRAVFERVCASCHVAGSLGQPVGPDLSDLSHRSVEDIASNILDPNMALNPGYMSVVVETKSEDVVSGILHSESVDAVVLLQALGLKQTIPRREIKQLESTQLSLMPEGLEAGMTPQELRDLVAFLQEGNRAR